MSLPIEVNLSEDSSSETYLMRLVSEKGQEIAQIKANRLEPLKRIIEDIKDQRQQLENSSNLLAPTRLTNAETFDSSQDDGSLPRTRHRMVFYTPYTW